MPNVSKVVKDVQNIKTQIEDVESQLGENQTQITNLINSVKVKTNITIKSATWVDDTVNSGFWKYDISDADITATTVVDINIRLADLDKATDIKSANLSSNGKVTIYANAKPTSDIICDLKIIKAVG